MHYDVTVTDGGFRVIDTRTGEVVKRGNLQEIEDFLDMQEQRQRAAATPSLKRS